MSSVAGKAKAIYGWAVLIYSFIMSATPEVFGWLLSVNP